MLMQTFCVIASSKSPVPKEFLSGVCAAVEEFERVEEVEVSIPHRSTNGLWNAMDAKLSGALKDGRRVISLPYFSPIIEDDEEPNDKTAASASPVDRVQVLLPLPPGPPMDSTVSCPGCDSVWTLKEAAGCSRDFDTPRDAPHCLICDVDLSNWVGSEQPASCPICGDPNARLYLCDRCGEMSLCARCDDNEMCACSRHWSMKHLSESE